MSPEQEDETIDWLTGMFAAMVFMLLLAVVSS